MLKRFIAAACCSGALVSGQVLADDMVDHYFTSMQVSVDTANQLGPKCIQSLKGTKKGAKPTGACTSFEQAYGIALDQADRLNQQMKNAHKSLPAKDARLVKLQRSAKKLNGYADTYYKHLGQ